MIEQYVQHGEERKLILAQTVTMAKSVMEGGFFKIV